MFGLPHAPIRSVPRLSGPTSVLFASTVFTAPNAGTVSGTTVTPPAHGGPNVSPVFGRKITSAHIASAVVFCNST